MMTKLREMSWIFLWVLIFAFIGLMVVDWGAGGISRNIYVGKIDGKKIKLEEYDKQLARVRDNMRQSGQDLDNEMLKKSQQQTWDGMIEEVVLKKYIEKYNITVTPEEVKYYVLNVPYPGLKDNPQLQTNGVFDMDKYRMAVQNDKNLFVSLYDYYNQSLPFIKLQDIITESITITDAEALDNYIKSNITVNSEYINIPFNAFASKVGEITDDRALAYYNSHKEDFKSDEEAILDYVSFPLNVTSTDSLKIYEDAKSLIKDLKNGENFTDLATIWSEDPSAKDNHGDLGFKPVDDYVKEFAEAVTKAKIGEITGPVKTQYGLHIIKVLKRKKEKNDKGKRVLKAHVQHILLKFKISPESRDLVQGKAQNFAEEAAALGFDETASKMGVEINTTPSFKKGSLIPGLGNIKEAVDFAFNEKTGAVSRLLYTKDRSGKEKYVVVRLKEKIPEGYKPFEKVKAFCKNRAKIEAEKQQALVVAESLAKKAMETDDLKEAAAQDDSQAAIFGSTGPFTTNRPVPNIGRNEELAYIMTRVAPLNEVYGPFETPKGFFIVKVTRRDELDMDKFNQAKAAIKDRILNQKKMYAFYSWWNKAKADVPTEDQRYKYYQNL